MSKIILERTALLAQGGKMGWFRRTNARDIRTPEDAIEPIPGALQDMSKEELIKMLMIYRKLLATTIEEEDKKNAQ
jgi:hypothetical protein